MAHRRTFAADASGADKAERVRIQARLAALASTNRSDATRRIGALSEEGLPAHDESLVQPRAFLMTTDGGVLAELACHEDAGPVTVGRGQAADICLADPYVHKLQAEIHWDASVQAHFITHSGGENGTYVNRHRIHKPLRLVGDERLRVGKTVLLYRIRR